MEVGGRNFSRTSSKDTQRKLWTKTIAPRHRSKDIQTRNHTFIFLIFLRLNSYSDFFHDKLLISEDFQEELGGTTETMQRRNANLP